MRIKSISVTVSKKITRSFGKDHLYHVFGASFSAEAELNGEPWQDASKALEVELKGLTAEALETPSKKRKLLFWKDISS